MSWKNKEEKVIVVYFYVISPNLPEVRTPE